ncbi:MAG: YkgJ family cysteine cluster protein [Methanolinea sp.]|nr:YkgJ family cysteine cluster protein [Methanolinea sp.]
MTQFLHRDPISRRLEELISEREALAQFPSGELVAVIRDVGFSCDLCSRCCTRAFNGHVLLLDDDARWMIENEPAALEPAPVLDFCDQNGTLYAPAFTLRSVHDRAGSCWFLEKGRCRVYTNRPWVCRIYPYMLHREPDDDGSVDWRQVSGLDLHGSYHHPISLEDAKKIAADVIAFESAVLDHEIGFLEYTRDFFAQNGLQHSKKVYNSQVRRLSRGGTVAVRVFYRGKFEEYTVKGNVPRRK